MDTDSLPTEIILTNPRQCLGQIYLDWMPQPGSYLELEGKTYAVLERHHHYQYKIGGYCLQKVSLYVQGTQNPPERHLFAGRWIIGDGECSFNAHSEILRCAVNPQGLCEGCRFRENSSNSSY
jgi:hypothetical protein